MSSKDNPCHGCTAETGRTPTCKFDGTCNKYSDWNEQHVQEQREIRTKIEAENMTNAFYIESGMRIRKSRRKKK